MYMYIDVRTVPLTCSYAAYDPAIETLSKVPIRPSLNADHVFLEGL
jgi:hypothetical protein